jgi:Protein of unknown function (DUF4089)
MDDGPNFDAQAVIDAMGPLIGIDIAPEFREGIVANLKITANFAAQLLAFRLGDHDEPCPVFEA